MGFKLEPDEESKSPVVKNDTKVKPKFELEADDDDYNDADFEEEKALRESQPERNMDHIKTASQLKQTEIKEHESKPTST